MPVLRIFAPTIFFSGLLGVLRGYFQAHGTMVPTSFSQIVEQILNAVVSILAAFLLIKAVAGKDTTHAGCIRRFGKRHRYRGRRTYRTAVHVWDIPSQQR